MIKEFASWMEVPHHQRTSIENKLNGIFNKQSIFDNGGIILIFKDGNYVFVEPDHYKEEEFGQISKNFVESVLIIYGKADSSSTRIGKIETYADATLDDAEYLSGTVKRGMRGYRGDHRSATRGMQFLRKVLGDYWMDPRFRKKRD